MPRRVISNKHRDKVKCYNKDHNEIMVPREDFLFLRSNVSGEQGLQTLCLTYAEAKRMRDEYPAPYVPNGFTPDNMLDINYFITSVEEEKVRMETAKYDADLSDLRTTPRTPKIKDEVHASNKIYERIKEEYIQKIETDDGLRYQRGMYLHSPDEDTPAYTDYTTGKQHFYNDGKRIRTKLPTGGTIWYSQMNGRELGLPLNSV
jgi:hypothetical protein